MAKGAAEQDHVPTPLEAWHYDIRFLGWLAGVFAACTLALYVYSAVSRSSEAKAGALLSGEPTAAAMQEAFGILRRAHLFGGWKVPDRLLPADDRVLGSMDEERLAAAAIALPEAPRADPGARAPEQCEGDMPCLIAGLGQPPRKGERPSPRYLVFRYLLLRRAMAKGEPLDAAGVRFFQWNVTLWVRAFERQVMAGKGTATASDAVLLRHLLDNRAGATGNALVFAHYGVVASLIFAGLLAFFWRRRRPQPVPG